MRKGFHEQTYCLVAGFWGKDRTKEGVYGKTGRIELRFSPSGSVIMDIDDWSVAYHTGYSQVQIYIPANYTYFTIFNLNRMLASGGIKIIKREDKLFLKSLTGKFKDWRLPIGESVHVANTNDYNREGNKNER